jgi:hypothetical protein
MHRNGKPERSKSEKMQCEIARVNEPLCYRIVIKNDETKVLLFIVTGFIESR